MSPTAILFFPHFRLPSSLAGLILLLPLFLLLVVAPLPSRAHSEYARLLPNGALVGSVTGCAGVGHLRCITRGGRRNQFGNDFLAQGYKWTKELCRMDSDGDGVSNGEEMGDPCCVWTIGKEPSRTTGLSLPGDAGSVTTVRTIDCNAIIPNNSNSDQNVGDPSFYLDIPSYVKIHAILMSIAFMALYPVAMIIVRYLRVTEKLWFYVHAGLVTTGLLVTLAGYILVEVYRKGFLTTANTHAYIGFILVVIVSAQVFSGLFRPNVESRGRIYWYILHGLIGITVLALGIAELFTGIKENLRNMWKVTTTDTLTTIVAIFTGVVLGLALVAELYYLWRSKCSATSSGSGRDDHANHSDKASPFTEDKEYKVVSVRFIVGLVAALTAISCAVAISVYLADIVGNPFLST